MDWVIGLVAVLAGAGVLTSRPSSALSIYLLVVMGFPHYVRISVGTIDLSASRIVVTLLLVRCLGEPLLSKRFRWNLLDTLVTVSMGIGIATLMCTTPIAQALENRGGFLMDAWFAYLVVRLIVTDRTSAVSILKVVAVGLGLLAFIGLAEATWGLSPYDAFKDYALRGAIRHQSGERFGLVRAQGSESQPIMFGMSFATLLPLVWFLRHESPAWYRRATSLSVLVVLGVLSSLSVGPLVQLLAVLVWLALENHKSLVKPLLLLGALACLLIELVSNRHFYYVLSEIAFDPVNGWYRARLFDVAVSHLPEYWVSGYGLMNDPGWGPEIIGLPTTDIVNQYVFIACLHGLPGVAALLSLFGAALVTLYRLAIRPGDAWERSLAWSLLASLVGQLVVFWTVCVFDTMVTIHHVVLALCGCLFAQVRLELTPSGIVQRTDEPRLSPRNRALNVHVPARVKLSRSHPDNA